MWVYLRVDTQPITTAWIYHNSDLWLISLSSDWSNWLTISDKNLGATQVYNDGDTLSESNCWKYFQRWNNYGFPFTWAVTTSSTQVNAQNYWPWNYYSSSTFITWNNDWSSVQNDNLRWDTTNTNVARKWPCDTWWHVPINTEWQSIYSILITTFWFNSNSGTMKTYLKMPLGGQRTNNSNVTWQDTYGSYWCSNIYNAYSAYRLFFNSSSIQNADADTRSSASNIRPFANTPVQPDDTWTVLYQPN